VKARVRDAQSGLIQAQLSTLDYLERQIQSDVKKAYAAWTASLTNPRSNGSLFCRQKKLRSPTARIPVGVGHQPGRFNAMNLMQTAKRAWDDAAWTSQRRYVALTVATGTLP
jgi:hypothetical protein